MPTNLENLQTRETAIYTRLAAGQTPGGISFDEPDMMADGMGITVGDYVRRLYEELDRINQMKASAEGGFEIHSTVHV